jgi:hypothetical protein
MATDKLLEGWVERFDSERYLNVKRGGWDKALVTSYLGQT